MTHHHHHNSLIIPIIIFFLISFYYTHILITNPSFNAQHHQKYNLEALVVKKIRFLLDPKSLNTRKSRNEPHSYHFSPSPSPSPSTSPVPSPAPAHAHAPHHHRQPIPHAQNVQKRDNKGTRGKRVLTAVIVSVGTLASVLFAMGLFFVCRKFKKQRRRPKRSKIVSKFLTSQSSVKKVSSDPGVDRFYLNSIETVLEPEKCCLKLDYDTGKILKSESCSGGECSVLGEISAVNEITELIKSEEEEPHSYECLSGEREISEEVVNDEAHSSDDESFHSFVGSSSSQRRLSNASAFSVSETSEIISEDVSKEIPQNNPTLSTSSSNSQPNSTPPPPPPPPSFSLPSTSKVRMKCNLPNVSTLKAPSAIPPPPCPPPLTKGHVNFSKVPPPPLQLPQQIPLGKDGTPLAKLKPLHWDKVRAAPDRSTVWDKLRSSSFEFDEEMIESLFGYNFQNSVKNDEMKSKTPSPSKHVLEPKRLQNITILSKALSVTVEQVCGALIRGDGLPLQDLEALSKMMPTKEEETALTNYKGDIRELGSAEKLVKVMLKIPFAFARIEAMLYRESFKDEVLHLRKSFSMLEEACKELRSSRLFLKLLEAVLKTGNRMNVGTIRGGAKAFKLDALLKLADVKGTDGKTTLLHFVVQEIIRSEGIRVSESIMGKINQKSKMTSTEEKEEHYRKMGLDLVTGLSNELCNVKKTATIDLDVLASSVANLRSGLNKLQHLVQKDMILEENKGNFVNSLRSFLKYGEMQLKELQEDENRVLLHVREITEYFHGNVSKEESNPLRIFVIVRDFLSMLDHVCKELRSSKVQRSPNPLAPFR